jgi:hypothetical protein
LQHVVDDGTARVGGVRHAPPGEIDGTLLHGRINLLTAPRQVLSMLPLVVDANGVVNDPSNNASVVTSLFAAQTNATNPGGAAFLALSGETGDRVARGDLSPNTGSLVDFEDQLTRFTRVSSLAGVRSDVFTVHVTVQAWRDVGTANVRMVGEIRQSYVVDRSAITNLDHDLDDLRVIAINSTEH